MASIVRSTWLAARLSRSCAKRLAEEQRDAVELVEVVFVLGGAAALFNRGAMAMAGWMRNRTP